MQSNGKVALVTGSGKRRVGNAIIEALAARGYQVAVHYNRSADDAEQTVLRLKEQGRRAEAFQADVAEEPGVDRLFTEVLASFGRLDVLVTAAAIWAPKRLEEVTAADVERFFAVNTLGTFLCCRRAGLLMAQQPEGRDRDHRRLGHRAAISRLRGLLPFQGRIPRSPAVWRWNCRCGTRRCG